MIKRFFDHKVWTILAASLAVIILIFLSAGLGNIHFQPGRPFARGESKTTLQISAEKIAEEIASIPMWKQVVFWALVLVLVSIVASMFPPEWRKKILKYFLRYALFVLALLFIVKNFRGLLPVLSLDKVSAEPNSSPTVMDMAPPVFTPPQVPTVVLFVISLSIVLVLTGIAYLLGRRWLVKKRLQNDSQQLEGLAEIARSSLADISSGKDFEDAIINCYARMNTVVDIQRGLRRRKDLTASEFVDRLVAAGLPGEAVRRLTRLFEAARYGGGHANRDEIAEAVTCLTAVLRACGVNE